MQNSQFHLAVAGGRVAKAAPEIGSSIRTCSKQSQCRDGGVLSTAQHLDFLFIDGRFTSLKHVLQGYLE